MTSAPVQFDLWLENFTPIAERFQQTLLTVIHDGVDGPVRAMDIQRTFDVGYTTAHRLHRAAFAETPRDLALALPGRPTILRVIEQANKICESKTLVKQLRITYEQFLEQVGKIASTQQELTAVLSAHDPEILREAAVRQRAAAFRTLTDLAGGYTESSSAIWVVRPNKQNPSFGDASLTHGYLGLRRLGVMKPITASLYPSKKSETSPKLLNGQPIDLNKQGSLIQELSSKNLPSMRFFSVKDSIHATYFSEDIPQGVPVDIVNASLLEGVATNVLPNQIGTESLAYGLYRTTKLFIGDYVIHRDMWPGIEPVFKMYDMLIPEGAYPDEYWFNEMTYFEELESLTTHRALLPPNEAPKHTELLRYTIDQMNLNLDDFQIYRIMIRYPVASHHARLFFSRKPEETQG